MEESNRPRFVIEHPVTGWNAVPGQPDSVVWWDGTAFTHEAVRSGDGWTIVDREGPVGVSADIDTGFVGGPTDRAAGASVRTRANVAIGIGLAGVAFVFVVLPLGILLLLLSFALALSNLARAETVEPSDRRRAVLALTLTTMELVAVGAALLVVMVATGDTL